MKDDELREAVARQRTELRDAKQKFRLLINRIEDDRYAQNQYKAKRDELNREVKELIEKGKEHTRKRDEIRREADGPKKQRRELMNLIKSGAKRINLDKKERYGYNITAKGRGENLGKMLRDTLNTLYTLDLKLQHEQVMFQMVFELHSRLTASKKAGEIHSKIEKTYYDIKSLEKEAQELQNYIDMVNERAQREHEQAVELFKEKDKVREEAEKYHKKVVEFYGVLKEAQIKIDLQKAEIGKRTKDLDKNIQTLRGLQSKKLHVRKKIKLMSAKEKLEKQKKMGLEDLKLLIESKSLKLDSKKKKKEDKE